MSNLDLRPLSIGELLDRQRALVCTAGISSYFIGIAAIPHLVVFSCEVAQVAVMPVVGKWCVAASGGMCKVRIPEFRCCRVIHQFCRLCAAWSCNLSQRPPLLTQGGTVFAVSELYLGRATNKISQSFLSARQGRTWHPLFGFFSFLTAWSPLSAFSIELSPALHDVRPPVPLGPM